MAMLNRPDGHQECPWSFGIGTKPVNTLGHIFIYIYTQTKGYMVMS